MRILKRLLTPPNVLIILMLATMIRFDRPLVRGDGVAYLAWADTLLVDRDIDLSNQVEKLRFVNDESKVMYDESQDKWVNVFPFGVAVMQAPFYLTGHFFAEQGWWDVNHQYFVEHQGVALPYSLWVMFGANLMALIAALLAYRLGRCFCDPMTSALAAYAIFVGSPLFYYSTVAPMHSHNSGAFAFACFLFLLAKVSPPLSTPTNLPRWRRPKEGQGGGFVPLYIWVLMGLFAGLTVLARWQILLAFFPAGALLIYERQWKGLLIITVVGALTLLPLFVVWHGMYGKWLLVPFDDAKDTQFLQSPIVGMWEVTIHTFKHSPILLLSMAGLPALWSINRRWALMAGGMIALQIAINGAALDWWAGESYGMRRMSELYALYVLLACAALGKLITWHWITPKIARVGLIGALCYCFLYILAFFHFSWTHPSGFFHADPYVMIEFFAQRERVYRWQVMDTVIETHLGPEAWTKPGP